MSTETAPAAKETGAAETGATPEEQPLGTPGLAALKSEREAKAAAEKRAAEAEARVKEFEDREKTEAQRQQEALEKAQKELAELTVAKTRAEIAATAGVPVDLLMGNTPEEIQASADRLKAWRNQQPAGSGPQRFVIPGEGSQPSIPLNGDGLEAALKQALGIS